MPKAGPPRVVAAVTGSRAEFGLLRPVFDAIARDRRLELRVIVAGSHLLPPALTIREVEAAYPVAARVPMQPPREPRTRLADARAVARGIEGFADVFAAMNPDWVLVLGDRVEAFAAASAASLAGFAVAHVHGGDRAEGIADEAMRHAITKLAHLHLAATKSSARRLIRLGERPEHVHAVGSPAIDGLARVRPLDRREREALGDPRAIFLMHPSGDTALDGRFVAATFDALRTAAKRHDHAGLSRVLVLAPNADAGSDHVRTALNAQHASPRGLTITAREHLPRETFLALLATPGVVLVGNSSAGLIEAAALGCHAINLGPRQSGRERPRSVLDVQSPSVQIIARAFAAAAATPRRARPVHPYGDGRSGPRIARLLATTDPRDPTLLRKRNAY